MRNGHCRHCEDCCSGGEPIPCWPRPEPHMNEDGAEWPDDCCPRCNMAAQLADRLEHERKRITSAYPRSSYPLSVGGYVEGLEFAAEAVADV